MNVTTPGCWAVVFDGEKKLGNSPGSFPLSAGVHRIVIRIQNKSPGVTRRVEIKPNSTRRLRIPCR